MVTSGLRANGFGMATVIHGKMAIGQLHREGTDGHRGIGHREGMDIIGDPDAGVETSDSFHNINQHQP